MNRRSFWPGVRAWRAAVDASRAEMFCARQAVLRQTEDIAQPEPVTQVQDVGCAVMAVGTQQDPGPRPMLAVLPDQPTNVSGTFGALGAAGRAQQCLDESAFAIEHDDRLEAELVVECIEQTQLLMAMNRIKGVIDIEHDPAWGARKGLAGEPDHLAAHADEGAGIRQVLHA